MVRNKELYLRVHLGRLIAGEASHLYDNYEVTRQMPSSGTALALGRGTSSGGGARGNFQPTPLVIQGIQIREGDLIGGILNAGGDPLAGRSFSAGIVTVFDPQGNFVARERVRANHRFRFDLAPGRYQLTVGRTLNPGLQLQPTNCSPTMFKVQAGYTTRQDAYFACGEY